MAFIRRVRTKSGAMAVQIAEYAAGRQRILKHVGSAHTEAELGVMMARARELLEVSGQGELELGVDPRPMATGLARPAGEASLLDPAPVARPAVRTSPGRVIGTDSRVLEPTWGRAEHPGSWRAVWAYSAKRAARDHKTLTLQENRAKAVIAGEGPPARPGS